MSTDDWRLCPVCLEEWPAEHFTYSSGSRYFRACRACWTEAYPRVFGPCAACGERVSTSRKPERAGEPLVHRRCRAA